MWKINSFGFYWKETTWILRSLQKIFRNKNIQWFIKSFCISILLPLLIHIVRHFIMASNLVEIKQLTPTTLVKWIELTLQKYKSVWNSFIDFYLLVHYFHCYSFKLILSFVNNFHCSHRFWNKCWKEKTQHIFLSLGYFCLLYYVCYDVPSSPETPRRKFHTVARDHFLDYPQQTYHLVYNVYWLIITKNMKM